MSYFTRTHRLIDTFEGVAMRIGRREANIEKDVRDFLELGLLKRKMVGGQKEGLITGSPRRVASERFAELFGKAGKR